MGGRTDVTFHLVKPPDPTVARTFERLVLNGILASNGILEKGAIKWTRLSRRAIISVVWGTSDEEDLMLVRSASIWAVTLVAAMFAAHVSTAYALTMKECSAKYKAAKEAGTLNGMKWNDFRKAECGADASAAPPNVPAAGAAPAAAPPTPTRPATTAVTPPAANPERGANSDAVFPSAVSPKYSSESPGKARMHTCLDQYRANKTSNGNGGLKWIEKGGGYYSECNKRLKG